MNGGEGAGLVVERRWCIWGGWHGWLTVTSKKAKMENVFQPTSSQLQAHFRSSHIGLSVRSPVSPYLAGSRGLGGCTCAASDF